jgi:hypothetical protein
MTTGERVVKITEAARQLNLPAFEIWLEIFLKGVK